MDHRNGTVYLIGAGPGNPGLITLRGYELLRSCDVILYDKLAGSELLSFCRSDAEKIFVGKEAGLHHVPQDETIKLMIAKAREGKSVARLKGGDPLIFGRGSEEAASLKKEGIKFEIVPGVSAGIGATAYAGIPLTHRRSVTQCVFVTAHETPGKDESQVDWSLLAQMKNTSIVIYMGAAMLPKITEELISNGMSPTMPSAIIENGTLPGQRTITCTLEELPVEAASNGVKAPLLIVISPNTAIRDDISWFESRPLFGKRIVSTRAAEQTPKLLQILGDLGAEIITSPAIRTEPCEPEIPVDDILARGWDWILFSSENGASCFCDLMLRAGIDARVFGKAKIASIGAGTSDYLRSRGILADFIPSSFNSDTFAKELATADELNGKRILRIKGDFPNDPLSDALAGAGAELLPYCVYKLTEEKADSDLIDKLTENPPDAVIFTSSSTAESFIRSFGTDKAKLLFSKTIPVSIGPMTTATLNKLGVEGVVTSPRHDLSGIRETLLSLFS